MADNEERLAAVSYTVSRAKPYGAWLQALSEGDSAIVAHRDVKSACRTVVQTSALYIIAGGRRFFRANGACDGDSDCWLEKPTSESV